jgi:hypothetical protein
MVLDGLGQGGTWVALWALATAGAHSRLGAMTGLAATAQQIGGAAGLAALVAVSDAHGLAPGFLATIAFLAGGALSARERLAIAPRERRSPPRRA